jgi:non-specific serine/threonine protein kinase/serine/threonine-protein kinase
MERREALVAPRINKMTPARWETVKQIAADALDLDASARLDFLKAACGADLELYAEVSSLLNAEDETGDFLEPDRPPDRIGPYRITREIGRGGMGAVYEGERDDGLFEQRVAIKVVKRGMDSHAVLRRFFAERQILARLQHPNIARLFDGGMAPGGRPYFVMEYLEGESIVLHCRRLNLSINARLDLFRTVCEAVEYAHSHMVLHRDLKSGNILVDPSGAPKLLDFGIARALDQESDSAALHTEFGQRAMTPQFASPEQIRGGAMTTASDVYSLGLLLYELLTGTLPYDISSSLPAEQTRIVCEQLPKRPSGAVPRELSRQIRGDLDNVVLKALEKNPAMRYQRAVDLADDIRRVQRNLPVRARPSGLMYRARKYVSRHKRAVAAAALVSIVLVAAVADALIQGRRDQRHFQEVRQLANSFMFEFHDAIANLPGATPARELVVRRATEYLDKLAADAGNDLDLKRELAESYIRVGIVQGVTPVSNLGDTRAAEASFEKAVSLFTEVVRARPADAVAKSDLARAKVALVTVVEHTDPQRAEILRQQVVALANQASNSKLGIWDTAQLTLGQAYFGIAESRATAGKFEASLDARNRSIEIFRSLAAKNPVADDPVRVLALSLSRRAALYSSHADMDKAQNDIEEAIGLMQRRLASNPGNAVIQQDLALADGYMSVILRRKGRLTESEEYLNRSMTVREEILRLDPRNLRNRDLMMGDYGKLAALRRTQNRLSDSMDAVAKGFAVGEGADPSTRDNPDYKSFLSVLHFEAARTASKQGDCKGAADHLSQAISLDPHPDPGTLKPSQEETRACRQ